jgi:hypothetical protein
MKITHPVDAVLNAAKNGDLSAIEVLRRAADRFFLRDFFVFSEDDQCMTPE